MASLKDLMSDLDRALAGNDLDQVASVRRTIAGAFPGSPAGAEASYKVGLDLLFRAKKPEEAAVSFREAAKAKSQPWSAAARVSLGLLLLREGKPQQAVFELRRVAGMTPPTIQTAQAAGFVVIALRELGNGADAERARKSHIEMLKKLTTSDDEETEAIANFMLGMEHKFDGDRGTAKAHLEKALASSELPPDEKSSAELAMQDL